MRCTKVITAVLLAFMMGCDSFMSYSDEYDDCRDEAFWQDGCPTGCSDGYNEEIEYIMFTAPPDICLVRQARSAFTSGAEACEAGNYDGFQQGYDFGRHSCQTLALNEFCGGYLFDTGSAIEQTCH